MFRAQILQLAKGPTLKMEGSLVGQWAEEAKSLVTNGPVPRGLVIDLTDVSYVDSVGGESTHLVRKCWREQPLFSDPTAIVHGPSPR